MIPFEKFKELFNCLDSNRHPEIEIIINGDSYILIKFENYISYGKDFAPINEVYKLDDIDELYETNINGICLKDNWNKVEDILIDLTFSVINNKEEINKLYHANL